MDAIAAGDPGEVISKDWRARAMIANFKFEISKGNKGAHSTQARVKVRGRVRGEGVSEVAVLNEK